MGRGKKYEPEQVVSLLRQIEVAVANGNPAAPCRYKPQLLGHRGPSAGTTFAGKLPPDHGRSA